MATVEIEVARRSRLAAERYEVTRPFRCARSIERPEKPDHAEPAVRMDVQATRSIVPEEPQPALQPAQLPQTASTGESGCARTPGNNFLQSSWLALAAAAMLACAIWWATSQRATQIDPQRVIATNLSAAQRALDEGFYLEPPERSALHHYSMVLALDPTNAAAKSGIDAIAEHLFDDVKTLIVDGKLAEAGITLERVRRLQPEHRRLAILDAQLRKEQERHLRFLHARELAALDDSQSSRAQPEPPRQHSTPGVQRAERQAAPAKQDTSKMRAQSLLEAQQAIEQGQLDAARKLIGQAKGLAASVAELSTLNASLEAAQQSRAKQDLLQLVLQRTGENRLLEPAQDSARHHLEKLARTDAKFPGLEQGIEALGGRLVANAQMATYDKDFDLAARLLSAAREIGFSAAKIETAEAALRTARAAPATSPTATAPAEPALIKYVPPEYPYEALVRGTEGWVDLSLSVAASGEVIDARVEKVKGNLFQRPALAAVRKWQYEPRTGADPGFTRRVPVRVQFRLDN